MRRGVMERNVGLSYYEDGLRHTSILLVVSSLLKDEKRIAFGYLKPLDTL
jgi:hypothetical protein